LQLVAAGWTADNFTITSFHLVVDKFSSQDDEYFGVAFFERGGSLIHARNWPLSSATLTSWERDFHSRYFFSIAHAIRPILRGRDIQRYGYNWGGAYLIAAAYDSHKYLEDTYTAIFNHLVRYEDKLKGRGQCQYRSSGKPALNKSYPGQHHWLELDNNPGQDYMDDFSKRKIVWSRLMRISKDQNENFPRFALIEKDYFVQDSLCFITGDQLDYLCAILNSNLGAFYYFINMAVLDNGGIQMRQHYVELFPIPNLDTAMGEKFRSLLGAQVDLNEPSFRSKMDQVVYDLYCFSEEEISHIDQYVKDQLESINDR
jgi:hypothetical protein